MMCDKSIVLFINGLFYVYINPKQQVAVQLYSVYRSCAPAVYDAGSLYTHCAVPAPDATWLLLVGEGEVILASPPRDA